jgi:hypothetical protein
MAKKVATGRYFVKERASHVPYHPISSRYNCVAAAAERLR